MINKGFKMNTKKVLSDKCKNIIEIFYNPIN